MKTPICIALFALSSTLGGCGIDTLNLGLPDDSGVTPPAPPPVSEPDPLPPAGSVVEMNDLRAGTCGSPAPGATFIAAIRVENCNEPHKFEVSGTLQRPESLLDAYPGRITLEADAERNCRAPFEAHTGKTYPDFDSVLEVQGIPPSALTWDDGDRTVICFIITRDGSLLDRPAADY